MLKAALCLLAPAAAQQAGIVVSEQQPPIQLEHCTIAGGCQTEQAAVVLDASWRWVHNKDGYKNCFGSGGWTEVCKNETGELDEAKCKKDCALEGVDAEGYKNTYGVEAEPDGVLLKFMSGQGNVGSRLYVTEGEDAYKIFKLLNREFTIDVDTSTLECGMNGAAYFIEMDRLGGKGSDGNEAGAKFGTGYCDAQCPSEKFVFDDSKDGNKNKGICCVEMDIWEANKRATAWTPHPCSTVGPTKCKGIECGNGDQRWKGLCDKDGCDMNSYRMGATGFYGPGPEFQVDSSKPLTVVTQFKTHDGTDEGQLSEIVRVYVQDGNIIGHANSSIPSVTGHSSITDDFCDSQKSAFGDFNHHKAKGGLQSMGETLKRGMVLSLSVWDDASTQMKWLDSTFPPNQKKETLGVTRGPCNGSTSHPDYLHQHHQNAYVTYKNIKYGEIGSTFSSGVHRRLDSSVHV